MKHKFRFILAMLLAGALLALPVMADSYTSSTRVTSIPYVRFTVNTKNILEEGTSGQEAMQYVDIPDNDYYTLSGADWIDDVSRLKVGDTPRMRVYLNAIPREEVYERYDKIWLFQGGYNTTNVRLTGGEFVSSTIRDSGYTLEVTLYVKPIRGTYDAPTSAYWDANLGTARWTAANNDSGLYDVRLYRNGSVIKKLETYSGNWYNFYPYMTKAADYYFDVRTAVPDDKKNSGANPSAYETSASLIINEKQVSDGTGQTTADEKNGSAGTSTGNANFPNGTGNLNVAGWFTDSTGTYFRYPSGDIARNGWLNVNGVWYLLDSAGRRMTGWQMNPKKTGWFYMDPTTGIMKTGWLQDGEFWYYLEPSGSNEGARVTGWRDIGGRRYYFNDNGIMVTGWFEIGGKWYYFYPQGTTASGYGYMATNTRIGDFVIGADGTWQK